MIHRDPTDTSEDTLVISADPVIMLPKKGLGQKTSVTGAVNHK